MKNTAKIEKIWINKEQKQIRVSWDNDRHQMVQLKGLMSDDVLRGVDELTSLIYKEIKCEKI